ncbi:rhodanese-like domain-containing protein [Acidobacteria bacterium ACD]|nr:MAG: rhodanese-like domain-containing protein [Acidobacteriota bacterium]MCE7960119.1 rhodanese-like domain-containing protein [Acidobacteria bacterium ACB2]MDL1948877.1 rhodanese-like domain-containing protein [Acidobacteria bacterium ACD]
MRRALLASALLLALASCAREVPWATEPIGSILERARTGKAVLVDVRPEGEWFQGHFPGALTLPLARLEDPKGVRLTQVYFGKDVFVYGARGREAQKAAVRLRRQGVDAHPLEDGYSDLAAAVGFRPPPTPVGGPRAFR